MPDNNRATETAKLALSDALTDQKLCPSGCNSPQVLCVDEPQELRKQQKAVKLMARQQLTVSSDSPFNTQEADEKNQEEQVRLLREETDEIKRQLDLVRCRLTEFNLAKETSSITERQRLEVATNAAPSNAEKCDERKYEYNQQITSSDSQFHRDNRFTPTKNRSDNANEPTNQGNTESTKLRPLTGKTDCPNCACDRRRQSVCDDCISFQQSVVQSNTETRMRRPSFIIGNEHQPDEQLCAKQSGPATDTCHLSHDERPIKPMKQLAGDSDKASTKDQTAQIDRNLVPNQIFTIGKSLNDKRAQLARAIEDLELLTDKVKKRGERLDQERKVAQLYKEQWRFGPTVGGGPNQAAQGQVKNKTNYQSRLDPQLVRDSNSLMGFRHIEPAMKFRQNNISNSSLGGRSQPSKAPQASPRQSLARSGSRMPSVAHQNALSNRLARSKQSSRCSSDIHNARSKSLDSLHHVDKIVVTGLQANPSNKPRVINHKQLGEKNFHDGKSSSEMDLTKEAHESEEVIEEELEEEFKSNGAAGEAEDLKEENEKNTGSSPTKLEDGDNQRQRVKKMTWVPVFGETEIKTVERRKPIRKTLVLASQADDGSNVQQPSGSILRQRTSGNSLSRMAAMKQRSHSAVSSKSHNGYSTVMNEATKKLQFANNLLEREHHDSRNLNQLVVNDAPRHRPTARVRLRSETRASFSPNLMQGKGLTSGKRQLVNGPARELISDANREIGRLENMIKEQQLVLAQLSKQSSLCCCGRQHAGAPDSSNQTRSKVINESPSCSGRTQGSQVTNNQSNQLIAHLRERLNKTKTRLAKTLEEERAKHQKLERRVHSSLRKQSDLRAENELLRHSLSKCIDTCLRDISNTFESLSETLVSSATSFGIDDAAHTSNQDTSKLTNVAQLIADNRYLNQMRSHIEAIEDQRRSIFEELSNEKLRSKQLELQLIQSKLEQDRLVEDKKKLERQLSSGLYISKAFDEASARPQSALAPAQHEPMPSTSKQHPEPGDTNSSSMTETLEVSQQQCQPDLSERTTSGSDEQITGTTSATFDSIDIYRKYIQSMTPDLDAIRRERRMILDEFDNIKKMLANMND